jgi:hypothetical protein
MKDVRNVPAEADRTHDTNAPDSGESGRTSDVPSRSNSTASERAIASERLSLPSTARSFSADDYLCPYCDHVNEPDHEDRCFFQRASWCMQCNAGHSLAQGCKVKPARLAPDPWVNDVA